MARRHVGFEGLDPPRAQPYTDAMKRPIIAGVLLGAPSGAFVGAFYSDDTTTNIVAGLVFGVVAALAVGAYVVRSDRRWKQRGKRVLAELEPEGIVHHSEAAVGSLVRAGLGVVISPMLGDAGGWLVLTSRRLVFIPHQHNLLGGRFEIPVAEIAGAKRGLYPNAIDVYLRSNESTRITVRRRDEWLAKLPGIKG